MASKISDYLPKTEILAQLAEKASKFSQAALELRRALDGNNPTLKSIEKCEENFVEEYADVFLCIHALFESEEYGLEKFTNEAAFFVYNKRERWLKRLQEYGVQKKDCL